MQNEREDRRAAEIRAVVEAAARVDHGLDVEATITAALAAGHSPARVGRERIEALDPASWDRAFRAIDPRPAH